MGQARKNVEQGSIVESRRLAELERAFAAYRALSPIAARRRYPRELRQRVLSALDEGVPVRDLLFACRITAAHIRRWQGGREVSKGVPSGKAESARVFSVAPDPPTVAKPGPSEAIEICVGRWRLELRLDSGSANRT